ncbi:hypothetical protein GMORB2_5635 [Geosmithia morbida]|uniref:Uncharacterized protein n=1 Tax=Geosmithia morbida TaxID=1094350 RepID=A0A9P5D6W2_9HYPO|nr:uncharacterized protein GMORB2_5635 [Geosmithia morbida]KAF4123919.1 hypothetical protein GMORB2_5635 [Geosmithia morbida]
MRGSGSLKVKSEPPSEPSSPGGTIDNSSLKPPSSPPYPPLGTSVAGMPIPASSEDKGMGSSSYGGLDHMPQWMAGSSSSSTADNMSWSNPWQPRPPNSPLPADSNATDPGVPPPPMGWEQPGSAASDAPRDLSWGQMPISADGRSFSYSAESIRSSSQDPAQYVPVGHQGRQTSGSSGPFSIGQPAPEGYHALPHMSMAPPTDPIMSPVGGGVVAAGGVSSQAQHMQWMHQQAYMRSQGAYGGGSWAPGQPRPE